MIAVINHNTPLYCAFYLYFFIDLCVGAINWLFQIYNIQKDALLLPPFITYNLLFNPYRTNVENRVSS